MLIKTEEFDKVFNQHLQQISIAKYPPPFFKGSYKIKPYGSVITDIDLDQKIQASEALLKRLIQIINSRSNFVFVKIDCGIYEEFIPPWTIGDEGGCKYDPKAAKKWFEDLGRYKILDSGTYERIREKLFSDQMTLKNLLEIKQIYRIYSQIVWNKEDIERGYKMVRSRKYVLLDLMRKGHATVAKYIYKYNPVGAQPEFCYIDFGLIDPRHIKYPIILLDYYNDNKYKIFKSYKWYLQEEYRPEFIQVIKSIENISGLLNRIKLYTTVSGMNLLTPEDRAYLLQDCVKQAKLLGLVYTPETSNEIERKLNDDISKVSAEQIKNFRKKLLPRNEAMLISYEMKASIAKIPVSQKVLQERFDKGFECPFFSIINTDFSYLYKLAQRTKLDPMLMLECMKRVAEQYDINMTLLINSVFSKNNYSIIIEGDKVIVKDGSKVIKTFSSLGKAQKYILVHDQVH
jgi:hypothetical protein